MKALSLWQPWASLLVHGKKRVETRGRALNHRGPLLIHAAKKWDGSLQRGCLLPPFRSALAMFGVPGNGHNWTPADLDAQRVGWGMPFGAIIGCVEVVRCGPTHHVCTTPKGFPNNHPPRFEDGSDGHEWLVISQDEWEFGNYGPGRFAILCENPVAFAKPIPYRGSQGLFEVPDELIRSAAA